MSLICFFLAQAELAAGETIARCPSCSLYITVVFDEARDVTTAELIVRRTQLDTDVYVLLCRPSYNNSVVHTPHSRQLVVLLPHKGAECAHPRAL